MTISFDWQVGGGLQMTINDEISGTLIKNQTPAVAVAFAQNTRDEVRLIGGDGSHAGALSAEPGAKQQTYVAVPPAPTYGLDEEQNGAEELMGTLKARKSSGGHQFAVASAAMQVRRLTPVECERLQGFPDGYTDIQPKGKPTADGPRYKALGNSMAVPCMKWIGKRIQMVEDL